jgi:microcompartment protein CcmK/EutM
MLLGKVVGSLVASQKESSMEGFKFLVLRRRTGRGRALRHR